MFTPLSPRSVGRAVALSAALAAGSAACAQGPAEAPGPYVVLGYNDLGMHCMQSDYADLMILPPFNTLHAQVIRRGLEPEIVTENISVRYAIPGNTRSADKNNFWEYPQPLLGPAPAPNVGLTGKGLAGTMSPTIGRDWAAVGIPIVPIDDLGRENPYPLAVITVLEAGQVVARTRAVVPTSTEMSCFLCHDVPGVSAAQATLEAHDRLHGTSLKFQRPVLCASCHADNALGLPGQPGISNLSSAMHRAHAPRMAALGMAVDCYACHPGLRTQCQRDVHTAAGKTCHDCHGGMLDVGNPTRSPWVDLPRCGGCHTRPGFEFEQPAVLFRNSVGHGGVQCSACHGSPHVITPSLAPIDNVQALLIQGQAGVINNCFTCHTQTPLEPFVHRFEP